MVPPLRKLGKQGVKPSKPTTWVGHQTQYKGLQNRLQDALKLFSEIGCAEPLPTDAYSWSKQAAPARPRNFTPIEQGLQDETFDMFITVAAPGPAKGVKTMIMGSKILQKIIPKAIPIILKKAA